MSRSKKTVHMCPKLKEVFAQGLLNSFYSRKTFGKPHLVVNLLLPLMFQSYTDTE